MQFEKYTPECIAYHNIDFLFNINWNSGLWSIQDTSRCDLSVNESCPQPSQAESKTSQTPLILPDLSPTKEDLNDGQTDESTKTSDSDDNDGDTTSPSTSTDSDDDGTTENIADGNSGDEQESDDSSDDDDGKDSDDGPSMIPFP